MRGPADHAVRDQAGLHTMAPAVPLIGGRVAPATRVLGLRKTKSRVAPPIQGRATVGRVDPHTTVQVVRSTKGPVAHITNGRVDHAIRDPVVTVVAALPYADDSLKGCQSCLLG